MDISGTITECKSHVILVMYYLFYFYGTKMNMTFTRGLRKASHSDNFPRGYYPGYNYPLE